MLFPRSLLGWDFQFKTAPTLYPLAHFRSSWLSVISLEKGEHDTRLLVVLGITIAQMNSIISFLSYNVLGAVELRVIGGKTYAP